MDYMKDFETVQKRLLMYLKGETLDRCCVAVTAPKDPAHPYIDIKEDSESWYMDAERILKRNLERFDKTYFAGDAIPALFPYFGTGGHGKYFRNDINVKYTKDTIWIFPYLEDCMDLKPADIENSVFFKRELEIMRYLAKEANGRFFIGMPDNTGSYDALAQLRGNEELLTDFIADPEAVKHAAGLIVDCLREASWRMFDVVKENCLGGSCHSWMNMLSTGRIMQLQCDLSVMLSPSMFEEFIMPELRGTLDFLDEGIYHIDGREQIRHLDQVLSLEKVKACQWVPVAGQPPVTYFIPEMRHIQEKGKSVFVTVTKDQVKPLLEGLSPKGLLLFVTDASSPEEADDIVKYVYDQTHDACVK